MLPDTPIALHHASSNPACFLFHIVMLNPMCHQTQFLSFCLIQPMYHISAHMFHLCCWGPSYPVLVSLHELMCWSFQEDSKIVKWADSRLRKKMTRAIIGEMILVEEPQLTIGSASYEKLKWNLCSLGPVTIRCLWNWLWSSEPCNGKLNHGFELCVQRLWPHDFFVIILSMLGCGYSEFCFIGLLVNCCCWFESIWQNLIVFVCYDM